MKRDEIVEKYKELVDGYLASGYEVDGTISQGLLQSTKLKKGRKNAKVSIFPFVENDEEVLELRAVEYNKFGLTATEKYFNTTKARV